jgi:thiol-disulfide isomerase/thioredoxin
VIDLTLRGRAPAPNKAQAQTEAVAEIAALPPLDLRDIEGRRIESADLAGRVVIVEFWATWCPPCRSTLGWLGEVKRRYGDLVEVVTVAIESEEPEVRKQAQSLKLAPRVVMGTEALAASFGTISSVPTMFVFDR